MKILIAFISLLVVSMAHANEDLSKSIAREVSAYLTKKESQRITEEYEFIRDAPTQTGIAYSKYYIWVRGISTENKIITEGAMRLAEIEKNQFRITDYVMKESILNDPRQLEMIFPQVLIPLIRQRAGSEMKTTEPNHTSRASSAPAAVVSEF